MGVVAPEDRGGSTVEYLLSTGRLERIADEGAERAADQALERAERRLTTAFAGLSGGDPEGAFVAAYDAYRIGAESLLVRQALRATGGDGSHATVEDAISSQFAGQIAAFAKPTFERFRRTRHSAQYPDPDAPEITDDDAEWAITTARSALDGIRRITGATSL